MIQRIQSIYLLLGALAVVALFFFDGVWSTPAVEAQAWFPPALIAVGTITAIAAVASIFLYKDRARQLRAVVAVQVLTLVYAALLYGGLLLVDRFGFVGPEGVDAGRLVALLLPIVAYVFFLLARRGIRRDIDLVKSMDRLR